MKNTVITIGNFDGLHLGHLKLINKVTELAGKYQLDSLVCSFDTNTKEVKNLLFPQNQLSEYLKELHIFRLEKLYFARDVKGLSCEEFCERYIVGAFHAKYVVVGADFCFGKGKSGNTQTLKKLGKQYGFETVVLELYQDGGQILSSSYLRNLIKDGQIEKANRYLYAPMSIYGTVTTGFHMGSTLSYPTANIPLPACATDFKFGVYKSMVQIDGMLYKSITNIGFAPTNKERGPLIETHIFDFQNEIYDKNIKVILLSFIREERKFDNFSALKKQIDKDVIQARK